MAPPTGTSSPRSRKAPAVMRWSEKETIDLIEAVKWLYVEDMITKSLGIQMPKPPGGRWREIADKIPPSQMSSTEAYPALCKRKFDELRRKYQATLNPPPNRRAPQFVSKAIFEKMKDYYNDEPPHDLERRYNEREEMLNRQQPASGASERGKRSGTCLQMIKYVKPKG